jgi:tight adherence protein C
MDLLSTSIGIPTEVVLISAICAGALMVVYAVVSTLSERSVAATRMARYARTDQRQVQSGLVRSRRSEADGFVARLLPKDKTARLQIERELIRAGFRGDNAVGWYFALRAMSAIALPGMFLGILAAAQAGWSILPPAVIDFMVGLSGLGIILWLTCLSYAGYIIPGHWLDRRIAERRWRLTAAFPNALDLLQISVEAGMGFDAAMTRVAHEMYDVAPDLAEEFLIAQMEIQAGKERAVALRAISDRTGVETITSFVNVVLQSIQFGTSMSDALNTYSREMRQMRELRAQEEANKLPVKMSAVLASLMLPAIVLICLGPVVIRYVRYFAE